MDYVALIARFLLAVVFVLAGLAKLRRSDDFARAITGYELLPQSLVPAVAAWLPRLEVAVGGLLLVGLLTVPAAVVLAAALVAFAASVGIALARGREIDCGCFGTVAPTRITWWTLGRNIVLLAAAILVISSPPTALAFESVMSGASSSPASAEAGAVLVATTVTLAGLALMGEARRVGALAALLARKDYGAERGAQT
ncbi:MAG: DoxX family membrane protein [Gaiellaceae bacterium MAG52_C11]|nr:DoxX family membrane protein [Candidatus Gaiellasilicea maunaloa]